MKLPLARSSRSPSRTAAMAPASPATKVTEPITTAFAARTRPRRGLAVKVTRIRPRRYSAVMNIVATTITAISPANAPGSVLFDGFRRPAATSGAMSPDPVTVMVPRPDETRRLLARRDRDRRRRRRRPTRRRAAGRPRLTWSKRAVARVGAPLPLDPPRDWAERGLRRGRGCGEHPGLHGAGQPGQAHGARPRSSGCRRRTRSRSACRRSGSAAAIAATPRTRCQAAPAMSPV